MSLFGTAFLELVEASLRNDYDALRQLIPRTLGLYEGSDRTALQALIESELKRTTYPQGRYLKRVTPLPQDERNSHPLVEEVPWPDATLVLSDDQLARIDQFVEEAKQADRLAAAGVAPRSRLLLVGPPGTGKTLAAGHIAHRLDRPLRHVRLDSTLNSYLGASMKNIRTIFDQTLNGPGFIFLDELDAIASARDASDDVGEIKRVVNTLLQSLDSLDFRCVVVAASNHAHMLDPAVWRRFPIQIEFALPDDAARRALWSQYLDLPALPDLEPIARLATSLSWGMSGSDIFESATSLRRTAILRDEALSEAAVTAEIDRFNRRPNRPSR